ncbi:hypothetical protein H8E88_16215 [candidate division KSB1 bacterium]|nr:hypothetical protein [candidate division KSB1 bacterium]
MRKSKTSFILAVIFLYFLVLSLSCKDDKTVNQNTEEFQFPKIDWIDQSVYNQIKETCRTYWDLNQMIAKTFEIRKDSMEYTIQCDGYLKGNLYIFAIRVDKNGNWLNDGRTLKNP